MELIRLNKNAGKIPASPTYEMDATKEYVIDLAREMGFQLHIMPAVILFGLPALNDYHEWLEKNGFDSDMPNPTNKFVSQFYGVKPLWKTELSQGIVVKNIREDDDNYYIVIDCSILNEGFMHYQIILTLAGCL